MKFKFTSHIKQHAGDILMECQDSFNYNLDNLTFAVSDGVSQAYRPELWSRILTEGYINNPDTFFTKDTEDNLVINPILGLRSKWAEAERCAYNNATPQEQFVLDMKKNAINVGAATFIGIKLVKEGISYQTIGDSVLFFYDYETKEFKAYSSMMPESGEMVFNNNPEYFDSDERKHGKVITGLLPYRKGILFMATDALSDWIIERSGTPENIEKILKDLMAIPTHEEFDKWVDNARTDANPTKLKDDDTTFIGIDFIDITDDTPEIGHNFTVKFDALLNDTLLAEVNSLRNELEEMKSAKSKSETALRYKEKQVNGLMSDLESCKIEIAEKGIEITRLNTENQSLNAEIARLRTELSNSESKCSKLSLENSTFKTNKSNSENEAQKLKLEVARLEKENKRLEGIIKAHKSAPAHSTKIDEETANLQSELNQARARTQKLESKLNSLKATVENAWSAYRTNGDFGILDLETFFSQLLGDDGVLEIVTIQQSIMVGKPTDDGGYEIVK